MVVTALRSLLDRARAGEQVEVGCLGGHGRTGTALACLAVLAGFPAADAVAWVRAEYCPKAVAAFFFLFTAVVMPGVESVRRAWLDWFRTAEEVP